MNEQNLTWHQGRITKDARTQLNGHRGLCIWLTGLSGAGKSTLANLLEEELYRRGIHTYLLDGDNVRHGLCADLGFSEEDRKENIRRVANVAGLFVDAGVVVLSALISPFESDREHARSQFEDGEFVEVYVDCPVDVCAARDPKGLYDKAKRGIISNFTGISAPYEPPAFADVTVNTALQSVDECVAKVMKSILPKLGVNDEQAILEECEA